MFLPRLTNYNTPGAFFGGATINGHVYVGGWVSTILGYDGTTTVNGSAQSVPNTGADGLMLHFCDGASLVCATELTTVPDPGGQVRSNSAPPVYVGFECDESANYYGNATCATPCDTGINGGGCATNATCTVINAYTVTCICPEGTTDVYGNGTLCEEE